MKRRFGEEQNASQNLVVPDYKAAGVWARSAFEWMMKAFCDKNKISVVYYVEDRLLSVQNLWDALQKVEVEILTKAGKETRPLIREEIGVNVTRAKSQHLNPLCHANLNSFSAQEIADSIKALEALDSELKLEFHSAKVPEQLRVEVEVRVVELALKEFSKAELTQAKKQIIEKLATMS